MLVGLLSHLTYIKRESKELKRVSTVDLLTCTDSLNECMGKKEIINKKSLADLRESALKISAAPAGSSVQKMFSVYGKEHLKLPLNT